MGPVSPEATEGQTQAETGLLVNPAESPTARLTPLGFSSASAVDGYTEASAALPGANSSVGLNGALRLVEPTLGVSESGSAIGIHTFTHLLRPDSAPLSPF